MHSGFRMPAFQQGSRVDTLSLKLQIVKQLGQQRAAKYFDLLTRYLSFKINKLVFDKLCIALVGRDNIHLHNGLIQAILKNSCVAKTPPKQLSAGGSLKVSNGNDRSSLQSLSRDVFPQSPRRGRTPHLRDRKFKDRPSPLGPHSNTHTLSGESLFPKVQEQQSATELLSLGSRPPVEVNSVEEGEEVDQAAGSPSIYSKSPVTAPFGISILTKGARKVLCNWSDSPSYTDSCHNCGELPDTRSLKKRLEQKLEMEGLTISTDAVNLLNNGLDAFLKKLMKPCMELAGSKAHRQLSYQVCDRLTSSLNGIVPMRHIGRETRSFSASLLDFQGSVEINPRILGEEWPTILEKVSLRAWDESI